MHGALRRSAPRGGWCMARCATARARSRARARARAPPDRRLQLALQRVRRLLLHLCMLRERRLERLVVLRLQLARQRLCQRLCHFLSY